jgi:RNA 3'-terminal phosphate cyclase
MKILKKAGHQPQTKLQQRVSKISTSELTVWAETSLYTIGKNIAGMRGGTPEALKEAEIGAEALLAIVQELIKRSENEF